MIVQTHFEINGREYIHTKSDADRYVVKDGIAFEESYDPAEFGRIFTEGEPIEHELEPFELFDIIFGGAE